MISAPAAALTPSPAMGWRATAWRRFRTDHLLKTVGTIGFMAAFFPAYFYLLRWPVQAPFVMPLTWVDRHLPFSPYALPVYLSLWLYVSIPPALLDSRRRLYAYGAAAAVMCLIGLGCFRYFPTEVGPTGIDWAREPGFAVLQGVDAAGNACPSLHVASAVFSGYWLHLLLREIAAPGWLRGVNLAWCGAIVVSTLATRQHVALDAAAGAALGLTCALGAQRWIGAYAGQPA
jgi:hypothetical protein